MTEHGYVPYTRGCRCSVCRTAKADYMRAHRSRRAPEAYEGITHGYAGYQEFHCRCEVCRAAKSQRDREARQRMKVGDVAPRLGAWSHGRAGYLYRRCRCVHCRTAYAMHRREYIARRRALTPAPDETRLRPEAVTGPG